MAHLRPAALVAGDLLSAENRPLECGRSLLPGAFALDLFGRCRPAHPREADEVTVPSP
jgi:hypothetical protein